MKQIRIVILYHVFLVLSFSSFAQQKSEINSFRIVGVENTGLDVYDDQYGLDSFKNRIHEKMTDYIKNKFNIFVLDNIQNPNIIIKNNHRWGHLKKLSKKHKNKFSELEYVFNVKICIKFKRSWFSDVILNKNSMRPVMDIRIAVFQNSHRVDILSSKKRGEVNIDFTDNNINNSLKRLNLSDFEKLYAGALDKLR